MVSLKNENYVSLDKRHNSCLMRKPAHNNTLNIFVVFQIVSLPAVTSHIFQKTLGKQVKMVK